ncbi:hypothetical protein LUU34_01076700 [Aix galericulata]|nr:hypothetical protein LUU34_01076700 [Aix galericulata]
MGLTRCHHWVPPSAGGRRPASSHPGPPGGAATLRPRASEGSPGGAGSRHFVGVRWAPGNLKEEPCT